MPHETASKWVTYMSIFYSVRADLSIFLDARTVVLGVWFTRNYCRCLSQLCTSIIM